MRYGRLRVMLVDHDITVRGFEHERGPVDGDTDFQIKRKTKPMNERMCSKSYNVPIYLIYDSTAMLETDSRINHHLYIYIIR